MDTVLNSIIVIFWGGFFLATIISLLFSFRKNPQEVVSATQSKEVPAEKAMY